MRVTALASGSSGNATLVCTTRAKLLIDAGLTARTIERALKDAGISPHQLDAIFLTHEHSDHVGGASVLSRRHRVPLVANEQTLRAAALGQVRFEFLPSGSSTRIGDLQIGSFRLPHDGRDPVGYWIEHGDRRLCLATDLGHAPPELGEQIGAADLVILEANHDRQMLLDGPYPAVLKRRVDSSMGHLSNEQAACCIVAHASGRPQWLWLAHLSAVNNSPRRAQREVAKVLASGGISSVRVGVALRDRRSLVWDSDDCFVQLGLALEGVQSQHPNGSWFSRSQER